MTLTSIAAAGAALAALALPSAAAAHPSPDHRDVRSHVRSADRSLDRVARSVGADAADRALAELRTHRSHVRAALRDARGALRSADGPSELRRVALAYRAVARRQVLDAGRYTALLGAGLPAALQTELARLLTLSLSEREDVLDQLTALIDEVPVGSRIGISRWIRQLTGDGQAQVGSLLGLLAAGSAFPSGVQDLLSRALELATRAVERAMGRLEGLVGMLPSQAQAPVRKAIDRIEETLAMVRGMFEALVGSLPATTPGQVPALPDFTTLLPELEQVLPGLGGKLLGGSTGGGAGGDAGNPVSGLLDSLLGGLLGGLR